MRLINIIFVIVLSYTSICAQTFQLDKEQSSFNWIGYAEVGGFSQKGTVDIEKGQLQLEEDRIQSATIVMDMSTIKSQTKGVDKHLKNKDFFFVKKYPEASIELISVNNNMIKAHLMIRGVSKIIEFPSTISIEENEIKVNGTLTIDRTQYAIKYNSSSFFKSLGDQAIKNEFDLIYSLVFKR